MKSIDKSPISSKKVLSLKNGGVSVLEDEAERSKYLSYPYTDLKLKEGTFLCFMDVTNLRKNVVHGISVTKTGQDIRERLNRNSYSIGYFPLFLSLDVINLNL